jgi:hypothetical protein
MVKKSYMKTSILLTEGFFSKLKRMFKLDDKATRALKKDKKFTGHLNKLNSEVDKLQDMLKDMGYSTKLNKFTASDFKE